MREQDAIVAHFKCGSRGNRNGLLTLAFVRLTTLKVRGSSVASLQSAGTGQFRAAGRFSLSLLTFRFLDTLCRPSATRLAAIPPVAHGICSARKAEGFSIVAHLFDTIRSSLEGSL
jgi:hypothetical protein